MGLIGILTALGLLIWLAYKGWSVLRQRAGGGNNKSQAVRPGRASTGSLVALPGRSRSRKMVFHSFRTGIIDA